MQTNLDGIFGKPLYAYSKYHGVFTFAELELPRLACKVNPEKHPKRLAMHNKVKVTKTLGAYGSTKDGQLDRHQSSNWCD